ncbi:DUF2946 domain-containing protein [Trinickia fusca]|uniref:DUF2946 domain-containing protein n=1 Tax=Trinickia fusca TaxID=2419777 RepID=A0A494XHF8_9BURK|nr:DUF2946 domain-containing protein [Trinickia fusca]RKP47534.1 DUF2946 domain-containing protein [Trinickia fusca]
MVRLRLERIGCLLGLLAILMATLAPTISQAMAARTRVDALAATYCSAQQSGTADGTGNRSSTDGALAHLQACGYCHLFAHAPVLPTPELSFDAVVWVIQARVTARYESLRRVAPLTAARPRAPPFLA